MAVIVQCTAIRSEEKLRLYISSMLTRDIVSAERVRLEDGSSSKSSMQNRDPNIPFTAISPALYDGDIKLLHVLNCDSALSTTYYLLIAELK